MGFGAALGRRREILGGKHARNDIWRTDWWAHDTDRDGSPGATGPDDRERSRRRRPGRCGRRRGDVLSPGPGPDTGDTESLTRMLADDIILLVQNCRETSGQYGLQLRQRSRIMATIASP